MQIASGHGSTKAQKTKGPGSTEIEINLRDSMD